MTAKKVCILLLLLASTTPVFAETPKEILSAYSAEAGAGFTPSAERGRHFFVKEWGVSSDMPSCSTCHTKDINANGKHVITGKLIEPLAPAANAERFTSAKKVAKWFKRNCNEVVGRECTAAEKADFIQFAIQGGKV